MPFPSPLSDLTRADVQAGLLAAQRTGDVVATGDPGLQLDELYPGWYPKSGSLQALPTCAQVAHSSSSIAPTPTPTPGAKQPC